MRELHALVETDREPRGLLDTAIFATRGVGDSGRAGAAHRRPQSVVKRVALCFDHQFDPTARKLSVDTEQESSKPRTPDQCRRARWLDNRRVGASVNSQFVTTEQHL